jgi:hypothetical protein
LRLGSFIHFVACFVCSCSGLKNLDRVFTVVTAIASPGEYSEVVIEVISFTALATAKHVGANTVLAPELHYLETFSMLIITMFKANARNRMALSSASVYSTVV